MRLAYFSPLSPLPSGISDYSEELLPCLAAHAQIELFIDDYTPTNTLITNTFPLFHYREFAARRHRYHAYLYHLGNDPCHDYIYETMLRYPSVVVLHDINLHYLQVARTMARGDLVGYMREMGYDHGRRGVAEARGAFTWHAYKYEEFPLLARILDLNLGLIVHNEYARARIEATNPGARVAVIAYGTPPVPAGSRRTSARRRLGLPLDSFIVSSLGFVTPSKRIEPALRAFAQFQKRHPNSLFLIVGEVPSWYDLEGHIREQGLEGKAPLLGRVSIEDFYRYIVASDLCLSLRYPTAGEASGSLLRILASGRPALVSRVGSFAELPAEVCWKVGVDEEEEEELLDAMSFLAEHAEARELMGRRARTYIQQNHSWERAAQAYVRFIQETLISLRRAS